MNVYLKRGIQFSALTVVGFIGFQIVSTCDSSTKVLPNGNGTYRIWSNCKPVTNSHLLPHGEGIYRSYYTGRLYKQDGSRLYPPKPYTRD